MIITQALFKTIYEIIIYPITQLVIKKSKIIARIKSQKQDGKMPQKKKSCAVIEAAGNSGHRSKKEMEKRKEEELRVPLAELQPPEWMAKKEYDEFIKLRDCLLAVNKEYGQNVYCDLDVDALSSYIVERTNYLKYTAQLRSCSDSERKDISVLQDKAFNHMRKCSSDLGLTISDRLRLIVPNQGDTNGDGPPVI